MTIESAAIIIPILVTSVVTLVNLLLTLKKHPTDQKAVLAEARTDHASADLVEAQTTRHWQESYEAVRQALVSRDRQYDSLREQQIKSDEDRDKLRKEFEQYRTSNEILITTLKQESDHYKRQYKEVQKQRETDRDNYEREIDKLKAEIAVLRAQIAAFLSNQSSEGAAS